MDNNAATSLIKDTFEQNYDRERFTYFAANLLQLDGVISPIKRHNSQAQFKEKFKEYIDHFERITKYGDNIDVIAVHLSKNTSLERARSMQREFAAYYMSDYHNDKNAVLAAFVAPDNRWRFSLVKKDTIVDTSSGKAKFKSEYSPVKRWSYLVGEDENSHTAQERFLPLLTDDTPPTLDKLEEAFSVDKVTKDFFNRYKALVERIKSTIDEEIKKNKAVCKEFVTKNINTPEFAKKLLRQIVFLYFLQKKGWFGAPKGQLWGAGDKQFLRNCFNDKGNKNYFNDILEPLFYEALARKRSEDYYYKLDCHIPFLNGGLFEPINAYDWEGTDLLLPDELFSDRKNNMEMGSGILDVFDSYNFTVCEDEPLESEVAIDPEMLGRVFENLLAVEERGESGTFYTPRDIVHYMCTESLYYYLSNQFPNINPDGFKKLVKEGQNIYSHEKQAKSNENKGTYTYNIPQDIRDNALAIDEKLVDIRVCDPAVGSGAYLVGMMTEIVNARELLAVYHGEDRKHYDMKRHCIQHSLYGVDISVDSVDIAKLRLWLSLIVDESNSDVIQPLPNLDYKVMCGDSLIQSYEGIKLVDKHTFTIDPNLKDKSIQIKRLDMDAIIGERSEIYKKIEKQKDELFNTFELSQKLALKSEIRCNINKLIEKILDEPAKIVSFHQEKVKPFFLWEIEYSEVFRKRKHKGFDIVIANPPYVQLQKMDEKLKASYNNEGYQCFTKTGDLYQLYYEKSYQLLNDKGIAALITSNKWMRAGYGKSTRNFFRKNAKVLSLIDLGAGRFETATVDTNVIFYAKGKGKQTIPSYTMSGSDTIESVENVDFAKISTPKDDSSWVILNPIEARILEKIKKAGKPLKEWDIQINYGIKTGCNEAFIISGAKKDELIKKDPKSAEVIRPILRGRDIKRYGYDFADLWLLFVPWHFPLHLDPSISGVSKEAEILFKQQYPAIYEHLYSYKEILSRRNKAETGIRYEWYALQRWGANYWNDFSKQKIVYPNMTKYLPFALINVECFINDKAFILTGNNLSYICGYLNSKIASFWLLANCPELQGGTRELRKIFVENLPVLPINTCITQGITESPTKLEQFLYLELKLSLNEIKFIEKTIANHMN